MKQLLGEHFGFSDKQLKALTVIFLLSLLLAVYTVVRDYSTQQSAETGLRIVVGDSDNRYQALFVVDLNSSPADSLELIPGIGPVFASRIIAYRDSVGGFSSIEEITKVKGISYKKFSKIKSYLTVSAAATVIPEAVIPETGR